MQRWFVSFFSVCAFSIVLAGAVSAQVEIQIQVQAQPAQIQLQPNIQVADRIAGITPGVVYNQNRLMQADAIFVGRVVAIEPMDVEATSGPGQGKVNYRIAVVQITETIHGLKKDTKMVRVGFVPQANNVPVPGNIQILPAVQPAIQPVPGGFGGRRPFILPVNLQVGQDGMFAVSKHHKENFYLAVNTSFVQRENNPNFDNEVKTAKQLAKVMVDPIAALKADDKQDRYLAAAILITKYRSTPTAKTEPIDADESKLILQALQGGDWTVGRFNAAIPNPFELFNQLNVNQKDGYNPVNVRNQQDIATAMQKWLDENNGKYRLQKYVGTPNINVQPGGIDPPQPVPPGIRPAIKLKNVNIQPIKGKVQILPVPAPQVPPARIELDVAPMPQPAPVRRD